MGIQLQAVKRLVFLVFAGVLCLLLLACQVEVHKGLNEEQANMMLGVLLKRGIQAEKIAEGKKGYTLAVGEKDLVLALEVLKEHNLPRHDFDSLGSVFAGQGMIASASEEQARMAYAIAQELSDTFSRIDGVLTARVHVVLGETEQGGETKTPASAAVFLRHVPESPVPTLLPRIRELTAKAVPNLDYKQVSVMLLPVREAISVPMQPRATFFGIQYAAENGPPYLLVALVTLFAGIGLGAGIWGARQVAHWLHRQPHRALPFTKGAGRKNNDTDANA